MKFRDKRKNEVNDAFSIEIREDRAYIRFSEHGKEYSYYQANIEILDDGHKDSEELPFMVYKLDKLCYKCQRMTTVLTYIVFDDGTNEDVTFPWDKERLLQAQHIWSHIQDPSIEYYGLKVIGDDERLDQLLMKKFPEKIQRRYSKIQERSYPMNLCDHCGAIQGWNYIYRRVNEVIKEMEPIEILDESAE